MKKGLTLAEVLVTLVILGTLTALTIPVIMTLISNNDVLYKSAFQLTENVVADLAQDLTLYPNGDFSTPSAYNFCRNFVDRINTIGARNCTDNATLASGIPSFTTTNGMKWYLSPAANPNFTVDPITIWVDLNGTKLPNSDTDENKDIFKIYVYKSGKVTAMDATEIGFLSQ